MPTKPARACRIGTCPQPAVSRCRCAVHAPADYTERNRFSAIYADPRWRRLSRQVRLEEPLCRHAKTDPLCTQVTEVADHITPHRGDMRLAFARENLAGLCRACHGRKTQAETNRRGGVQMFNRTPLATDPKSSAFTRGANETGEGEGCS